MNATSQPTQIAAGAGNAGNRTFVIAALVCAALAIAGFVVGLKQNQDSDSDQSARILADSSNVADIRDGQPRAAVYQKYLDVHGDKLNRGFSSQLGTLVSNERPTPDGDRSLTVEQRKALRAYDGAPPVVPHPIHQRDTQNCLSCHGEGLWIDSVFARPISHDPWPSCTQCHVEGRGTLQKWNLGSFSGMEAMAGVRYVTGAPPVIPHTATQVALTRSDCMRCHGTHAWPGVRYTQNDAHRIPAASTGEHEDRKIMNLRCQQCHVLQDR